MATLPPQRRRRPPVMVDDLIPEILLRLPPDEPKLLFRFSAVCRSWRDILANPSFLRRYRAFHGTPPMLGFLFNQDDTDIARFVPTSCFRPRTPDHHDWYALDARHGRVLFHTLLSERDPMELTLLSERDPMELVVWNPITDEQRGLLLPSFEFTDWDAAVLCAARGCDHLDCHGGPFLVAFVGTTSDGLMSSCVYSSEAAAWSDTTPVENSDDVIVDMMPAALVGNTLYFNSQQSRGGIVEYDFGAPRLSLINPPSFRYLLGTVLSPYLGGTVLMPSEGGGLGFASTHRSCLHRWAREAGPNGTAAWVQQGYIELRILLPEHALRRADAVGFAEVLGVIFVSTDDGVFIIELKSHRVAKVSSRGSIYAAIPYMSFYTPDLPMG